MRFNKLHCVLSFFLIIVFFAFLPLGNTDEIYRFVVAGDTRGASTAINEEVLPKFVNIVKAIKPKPQCVVFTGDEVLNGGKEELEIFKKALIPITSEGIPIYPMIGNHELKVGIRGKNDFVEAFDLPENGPNKYKELAYYAEGPNALLVVLDAYPIKGKTIKKSRIDQTQRRWLKRVLREHPDKFKFVFAHPPAYPVGSHTDTSLDVNKRARDAFWRLLNYEGVADYFCGHEHIYARYMIDEKVNKKWKRPIPQFTIGSTGAPIHEKQKIQCEKFVPTYHYAIVDVHADRYEVKVYDLNGNLIDDFVGK